MYLGAGSGGVRRCANWRAQRPLGVVKLPWLASSGLASIVVVMDVFGLRLSGHCDASRAVGQRNRHGEQQGLSTRVGAEIEFMLQAAQQRSVRTPALRYGMPRAGVQRFATRTSALIAEPALHPKAQGFGREEEPTSGCFRRR